LHKAGSAPLPSTASDATDDEYQDILAENERLRACAQRWEHEAEAVRGVLRTTVCRQRDAKEKVNSRRDQVTLSARQEVRALKTENGGSGLFVGDASSTRERKLIVPLSLVLFDPAEALRARLAEDDVECPSCAARDRVLEL
jgi:hypothetical protein